MPQDNSLDLNVAVIEACMVLAAAVRINECKI